MNADGSGVRQISFDQDASWHPAMMENGRVLYTRWEYTDSAHYFSRVLMTMNPDGTDQKPYYGSNSYWPNSMFFARQIPGHPTMFISTITGHHSNPKGGALCLFDVSKGREEADGALQLITGRGKPVEPLVIDNLAKAYSPMFYHPYPLSDKYFLAMTGNSIYLLDVFDNMLCLKKADKEGGYYEPLPLRKTRRPPRMPDRINLASKEATVLINDVYEGPGLAGVPRGTVKSLRLYRYEFGPRHKGGHYSMGMEAGWDAKQILGTVPVEADGSASFKVPANTPFAMQPLDEEGKALQLMRSWTVAMPGERLSCVGCHESQNTPPLARSAAAMLREPSNDPAVLRPGAGIQLPARGSAGVGQVLRGLPRRLEEPHARRPRQGGPLPGGRPDHRHRPEHGQEVRRVRHSRPVQPANRPPHAAPLRPPQRAGGRLPPAHAAGIPRRHERTRADAPEGAPRRATRPGGMGPPADVDRPERALPRFLVGGGGEPQVLARRKELRKEYAGDTYDPEKIVDPYEKSAEERPAEARSQRAVVSPKPAVVQTGKQESLEFDLGDGVTMKLVSIPAGEFSMGSNFETAIEQPVGRVKIDKPFFMGTTEVTLEQYRQFDREYLNGVYDMHYKDQVKRGYYMNDMRYPVIRVSWHKAMEFCQWLSKKTGRKVTLPTEAQWEWACRAGTDTPLSFGDLDADFSKFANLADVTVKQMAVKGVNPKPIANPGLDVDFELKDPRSNDGVLHLAKVGSYQPNPWGLYDMHGNAAEWTRSDYKPYPYNDADGRNADGDGRRSSAAARGTTGRSAPLRPIAWAIRPGSGSTTPVSG